MEGGKRNSGCSERGRTLNVGAASIPLPLPSEDALQLPGEGRRGREPCGVQGAGRGGVRRSGGAGSMRVSSPLHSDELVGTCQRQNSWRVCWQRDAQRHTQTRCQLPFRISRLTPQPSLLPARNCKPRRRGKEPLPPARGEARSRSAAWDAAWPRSCPDAPTTHPGRPPRALQNTALVLGCPCIHLGSTLLFISSSPLPQPQQIPQPVPPGCAGCRASPAGMRGFWPRPRQQKAHGGNNL